MDEWRRKLRAVAATWGVSPEDQAAIVEELEQHLELELAELRLGVGDAAAQQQVLAQANDPALRDMSVRSRHNPAPSVESSRMRGGGWSGFARDVRHGWRSLVAGGGTTVAAVVALALGIGLTTVMFSIVYGTLLRGLPYDDGRRIAVVMRTAAVNGVDEALSIEDFVALRTSQRSFETFGAYSLTTVNLSDEQRPERVEAARVTAEALAVTRVAPLLGRHLRIDDERAGAEPVAILSYSLWLDRYAGDSSVIGRTVRINGQREIIVGVMPDGFAFPNSTSLWMPLPTGLSVQTAGTVAGVGRLRRGVSFDQANAELATIMARLAAERPDAKRAPRAEATSFVRASVRSQVFTLLYAMFGAVGLVFLIACTNVANILLARAVHRLKEVAVRRALGASRLAIARQFLVEAVILAGVAAMLGALVAQAGLAVFRDATAGELPYWVDLRLQPAVFSFIAIAALAASIVSGLLPAMTAARSDITGVLKDQALGSSSLAGSRLSRVLVGFELMLSAALLVVAMLATRSVLNLRSISPGFRTENVLTGRITLSIRDSSRQAAFFERLEESVAHLPGATSIALSTGLPGTGWGGGRIALAGENYATADNWPAVRRLAVTPGFFSTFGVAAGRGRLIRADDRPGAARVVVVNQRFVDDYFHGTDPIGARINLTPGDSIASWATIVGVIPTLYSVNLQNPWPAELLTAFRQERHSSATIAVGTAQDPAALGQPLRTIVASLDPDLPVYELSPMDAVLGHVMWPTKVFGGLFVVFAIVALALASIGLYAVIAFSVGRREREMGIRLALGATARDVVGLVFADGARQLAIGVPLGLAIGIGAAYVARAAFFGVQPNDPLTLGIVIATVSFAGFAACLVPAARATRSDPVRCLRSE